MLSLVKSIVRPLAKAAPCNGEQFANDQHVAAIMLTGSQHFVPNRNHED